MSWSERLNLIGERAEETNTFAYNLYVRKLYFKLLDACEFKNAAKAKQLIIKMGF